MTLGPWRFSRDGRHALVSKSRSAGARTRLLLASLASVAFLGAGEANSAPLTASWIDDSNGAATTQLECRPGTVVTFAAIADVPPGVTAPVCARATLRDAEARSQLAGLRLPFIANQGQVDGRVAYYAPTFAGTVFVTQRGELVYALAGQKPGAPHAKRGASPGPGWSLTETLRGGRARPSGKDRSATGVSNFLGNNPARWRSYVSTYEQVSLGEVWPGVTVSLRARGRSIEKVFTVAPGASVAHIRVRVGGARALAVDHDGGLVAGTGLGAVTFTAPVAYQERDGVRRSVEVAYRLTEHEYRFSVGAYDPALPLVIDPLLQSTYLGGNGEDQATAVAIHPTTGDVYVAGSTSSTNFPGTAGGAQTQFGGGSYDAFIARFPASLTSLTQATYLGGSGQDYATKLVIHPTTGNVYVAGVTVSTDFPGTAGGAQTAFAGGISDAFVARLPSSLTSLTQATYLGGSGYDPAGAIAIHPTTGDVYVAGSTSSVDFPGKTGGAQPTHGGAQDAFVARLTSDLTSLTQATYLGGSDAEGASALDIHPTTGDVYVAGFTSSTDFPGTAGGAQPALHAGSEDAFIARFPFSLTSLTQATYLGGSDNDDAMALAIHPTTGDVYVAGSTSSTNFPGTAGGAPFGGGTSDAFVARLTASLTSLTQATYLGGSGDDNGLALAIHPTTGDVYMGGDTLSTNFPGTTGGAQATSGGNLEAFVARLTRDFALEAPVLSVTPSSLNFGTITVNTTTDLTFTVQNTGGGTLTGTAAAAGPPFSVVAGSPFSVGAGASQTVTVRFSPTSGSTFSSNVNFISNAGNLSPSVTGQGQTFTAPAVDRDFNGDGKADLLWRHTSGAVAIWLMNGTAVIGSAVLGTVTTDWTIVGVRDFNGDGKADLLWRHTSGAVAIWFMNGTAVASGAGLGTVPTVWQIQ